MKPYFAVIYGTIAFPAGTEWNDFLCMAMLPDFTYVKLTGQTVLIPSDHEQRYINPNIIVNYDENYNSILYDKSPGKDQSEIQFTFEFYLSFDIHCDAQISDDKQNLILECGSKVGLQVSAITEPKGHVRQCGVISVLAIGLHFQAALGVICSG